MKKLNWLALVFVSFLSLMVQAQSLLVGAKSVPRLTTDKLYELNDNELRVETGLTIADLAKMAREGQTDILENIFSNYGVSMRCLPSGTSVGRAGQVLSNQIAPLPTNGLTLLAEASWYGKQFKINPDNCAFSGGVNRIYGLHYVKFVSRILPNSPLVNTRSNIVELNYARPGFGVIPKLVQQLGVYDLMVAIPGKFGPIYIGKTWFGKYNNGVEENSFEVNSKQTNWYFLDFNPGAVVDSKTDSLGSRSLFINDAAPVAVSDSASGSGIVATQTNGNISGGR